MNAIFEFFKTEKVDYMIYSKYIYKLFLKHFKSAYTLS